MVYTDVWASMGKEAEKEERKVFYNLIRSMTIFYLRLPLAS